MGAFERINVKGSPLPLPPMLMDSSQISTTARADVRYLMPRSSEMPGFCLVPAKAKIDPDNAVDVDLTLM